MRTLLLLYKQQIATDGYIPPIAYCKKGINANVCDDHGNIIKTCPNSSAVFLKYGSTLNPIGQFGGIIKAHIIIGNIIRENKTDEKNE